MNPYALSVIGFIFAAALTIVGIKETFWHGRLRYIAYLPLAFIVLMLTASPQ